MKESSTYSPKTAFGLLLVGTPGTGKTSLALHLPGVYLLDADNNLGGPTRKFPSLNFFYDTVNIDDNGNEVPVEQRYQRMVGLLKTAAADARVKAIVIDSLTSVVDYVIADIKRQQKIPQADPLRIQDWGTFQHYLKTLVTSMRSVGKLFCMTAHQEIDKDDATGAFRLFLACPGKSRHNLAGLFSDVWNTYIKSEGVPPNGKLVRRIATAPRSSTDERGLKDSLLLPIDFTQEDAIKHLTALLT